MTGKPPEFTGKAMVSGEDLPSNQSTDFWDPTFLVSKHRSFRRKPALEKRWVDLPWWMLQLHHDHPASTKTMVTQQSPSTQLPFISQTWDCCGDFDGYAFTLGWMMDGFVALVAVISS